jgi:hypothetical protein
MKRGKTWALVHMAMEAYYRGLSVVFMSFESDEYDTALRMWQNMGSLTQRRFKDRDENKSKRKVKFTDIRGDFECLDRPFVSKREVLSNLRKMDVQVGRMMVKSFKMGSGTLQDIENYLNALEVHENFFPHVIVVDYLGIIQAPYHVKDMREKYNYNSAGLKALAQDRKAIVFSGHQATRKTLEAVNVKSVDIAEDIRVLANVDVMYALHQTEDEKNENKMRIGVMSHRHSKFRTDKQAKVIYQFEAGQFVLDSELIDKPLPKDKHSAKAEEAFKGSIDD